MTSMKHTLFLIIPLVLFSGCFNDRGISARYYNDCEEYYDSQGYYHKKCDPNMVEYSEIKSEIKKVVSPIIPMDPSPAKVW